MIRLSLILLLSLFYSCSSAQKSVITSCNQTILDFGAKMDGQSDDSKAIQESLNQLDYAFIPRSQKGALIKNEILITNGQKVFGEGRSSKITSYVSSGKAALKVEQIPFSGDAIIENLTLEINTNSIGIHILESRNTFVNNVFVNGKKKCTSGILLDGGTVKGSAWNQIDKYTILHCDIGINLTSNTKRNWCNRNIIGFGVVQSCNIGVKLNKANTNKVEANPQGTKVAFQLTNAHHNRFESFTENSSDFDITIDKISRQNTFVGEFSPSLINDKGKDNNFLLSQKRTKMYYDRIKNN